MQVEVVSARPDDFAEVFMLLEELWPGRDLNKQAINRVYLNNLYSEMKEYYVARDADRIVGFITMHIVENLWAQGCLLQIEELVVSETCRGQGIGRKLVEQAFTLANERSCRSVEVTSAFHRSNAHLFYESCGFVKKAYHFIRE